MPSTRRLLVIALTLGALTGGALPAPGQESAEPRSAGSALVTRVFYLHGIEPREAMQLLRSQLDVRRMAAVQEKGVLVVGDALDKVDASEKLLLQRDAIERVSTLPETLDVAGLRSMPAEERVFHVTQAASKSVVVILRSIYQVRDLTESAEENSVSIRAATPVLDSSEALLKELGLLAEES